MESTLDRNVALVALHISCKVSNSSDNQINELRQVITEKFGRIRLPNHAPLLIERCNEAFNREMYLWQIDTENSFIEPRIAFQLADSLIGYKDSSATWEIEDIEPMFDFAEDPRESSGKKTKQLNDLLDQLGAAIDQDDGNAAFDIAQRILAPPAILWNHKQINLTEADRDGEGITIAHIDTGYQEHPEIVDSLLRDGGEGIGRDFVQQQSTQDGKADNGVTHGCSTASVIVGKKIGVAPKAKLLPLRTRKRGVVYLDWSPIIRALAYVNTRNDIDIVSMSLGGPFFSRAVHKLISKVVKKGVIVIAAAGNQVPLSVVYPASDKYVISVAACDKTGKAWQASSRGTNLVTTAPGADVLRAMIHHFNGEDCEVYWESSGTSYATAHIAGVCALWLQKNKEQLPRDETRFRTFKAILSKKSLHTQLLKSGDPLNVLFGGGIVNVRNVLDAEVPISDSRNESNAESSESPEMAFLAKDYPNLFQKIRGETNSYIRQNFAQELVLYAIIESKEKLKELNNNPSSARGKPFSNSLKQLLVKELSEKKPRPAGYRHWVVPIVLVMICALISIVQLKAFY